MKTQKQLDIIIRKNKGKAAVDLLDRETTWRQEYMLSDGTLLTISKVTGKGHIECRDGRVVKVF